ncbi:MAG TPA: permease prefix domain 1-containing protein [Sumerlaeia bacterium]|nr:permease prefix domain 1-containing protein [Sumerlaeia bacterium]
MTWLDEIAEGFPSRHDREPASLRRDIADELADHLALAVGREMARTNDAATARRAALERFGDPKRLARRLWFDAMKGEIMKDRMVVVGVLLMAAVCFAMAAFMWVSLAQNRETNRAMLEIMQKMAAPVGGASEETAASGLSQLTIRVVRGKGDGEAIPGAEVQLNGCPFGEQSEQLTERTDRNGLARFGPLRPGKYHFTVPGLPRDHVFGYYTRNTAGLWANDLDSDEYALYGTRSHEETIVYPSIELTSAAVTAGLPDDTGQAPILLGLSFVGRIASGGNCVWQSGFRVCLAPDGRMYEDHSHGRVLYHPKRPAIEGIPLPAMGYRLASMRAAFLDDEWEKDAESGGEDLAGRAYKVAIERNLPLSGPGAAAFQAIPRSRNDWRVEIPENLIGIIREEARVSGGLHTPRPVGTVEPTLAAIVDGKISDVVPIVKDTVVRSQSYGSGYDNMTHMEVMDFGGGAHTLVQWRSVPDRDPSRPDDCRFLLALYAWHVTKRDESGPIRGYEAVESWLEKSPLRLEEQPEFAAEPVGVYELYDDGKAGWRLFDVTPLVQSQIQRGRAGHGFMLRFDRGDVASAFRSGYTFLTREAQGTWAPFRPVLLVVEPKGQK